MAFSGTPVLSGLSECQCSGPWSLWWRQALGQLSQPNLNFANAQVWILFSQIFWFAGEYLPMPTPTTSTRYPSTQIRYCLLWDYFNPSVVVLWRKLIFHRCLQETYLSADDLRINLWHMEITDQSFNIVDIKPANMEELTEVNIPWSQSYLHGAQNLTTNKNRPSDLKLPFSWPQ